MPYLRQEDILRPTTTPERANFINNFYSRFNIQGGAAHKKILNVEPLFYEGLIAGTEFLVYAITKLYITYQIKFNGGIQFSDTPCYSNVYDENNAVVFMISNQMNWWQNNTNVNRYNANDAVENNFYFSRLDVSVLTYMMFNGYRITLN
jgi:hypothetical protein